MSNQQLNDLAEYLQYQLDSLNGISPIESVDSVRRHSFFFSGRLKNDVRFHEKMNELAKVERRQQLAENIWEEPHVDLDFHKFMRYSTLPNCAEIFVGDKWIVVPKGADVKFSQAEGGSVMIVNIRKGNHTFTYRNSNFRPQEFAQNIPELRPLNLSEVELIKVRKQGDRLRRYDKISFGIRDNFRIATNTNTLYRSTPKDIKMQYVFKIKDPNAISSGGRAFRGVEKLSKGLKWFSPVGYAFTGASIYNDWRFGEWNTHTAVDGGLLVLDIAAAAAVSAGVFATAGSVVLVGIAIYGLADYCFDIGGYLDENYGINPNIKSSRQQINAMESDTSLLYELQDLVKPTLQQLQKVEDVPVPADKIKTINKTFQLPLKD